MILAPNKAQSAVSFDGRGASILQGRRRRYRYRSTQLCKKKIHKRPQPTTFGPIGLRQQGHNVIFGVDVVDEIVLLARVRRNHVHLKLKRVL